MNDRMERMQRRQGDMMQAFLTSEKGKEWVEKHYEVEEGTLVVLSKGERAFPIPIMRQLLTYQKEHVLFPPGTNLTRSDCVDVALNFESAFEKDPTFRELRDAGYFADSISAGQVTGNPLTFFRERGFGFHEMNVIEHVPEEGKSVHAAVDLTAHYNMGLEEGKNDIFMLLADSREELLDVLKEITHVRWSNPDD